MNGATETRMVVQALDGIGRIGAGDDLVPLILAAASANQWALQAGDIVVVAQKIVSKSEGRQTSLAGVTPSPRARDYAAIAQKDPRVVELVLGESRSVLRCVPGVLIVEDRRGLVLANAGIDASNVDASGEMVLLLPVDPDRSAARLAQRLSAAIGGEIGVIINDSIGRAWRNGTIGTAIGVAGLPALLDLRGTPDLNGRALQSSELGLADEIAAAASLLMGQAAEGRPVVLVRGVPYARTAGQARDLLRPPHLDLFR